MESKPQKMLDNVIMFGRMNSVFRRSIFLLSADNAGSQAQISHQKGDAVKQPITTADHHHGGGGVQPLQLGHETRGCQMTYARPEASFGRHVSQIVREYFALTP